MRNKAKLLIKIVTIVLALFIAVICFARFVPGFEIYVVQSGSMEPAINVGDVIITGPVNDTPLGKVQSGTIITFQVRQALTTHRVVSINGDTVVTKGDANEDPDPTTISVSQIKGVYLFRIPYIGYLTYFIRTRTGWFLAIMLPAIVLVGFIIKDIIIEALRPNPQPKIILVNKRSALTKSPASTVAVKSQAEVDDRTEAEATRIVSKILAEIRAERRMEWQTKEIIMCSEKGEALSEASKME